jgi:hypothetical protein
MDFHEGLQEQWKDILRLKTKEYIQNLIITHEEEIDKNVFGEILSSLSKDGVPDENIMKLQNEFDEILNDILNTILPSRWVKRETYISKYLKIPKGRISEVWGYENKFKNGKNDKLLRN